MWSFFQGPAAVRTTVEVAPPRHSVSRGMSSVAATVDGRKVWFASRDIDLAPAPEAFGAAFLVPALHASRSLHIQAPVCDTWAGNLQALTRAFQRLWYPHARATHVLPVVRHAARPTGTALCFSGGVDAFYTLLAAGRQIDTLVYAVGYDVKLRERRRAAAVTRLVRDVAADRGIRAVAIHTNLRRHPLQRSTPWALSYGGALAAIGHLIGNKAGRLLTSSDGLGFTHPQVGSRPDTDRLHSSRHLAVEHVATGITRLDKIRRLAAEPLVQRHLRVCWKNVGDQLNCGRCEKCVRTMIALDACGALGQFPGFDQGRGLIAAIDGLPAVEPMLQTFFHDTLGGGLTGLAASAVRRLLDRSPQASAPAVARPAAAAGPATVPFGSPSRRRRLLAADAFVRVFEPLVGRRVGYVRPLGNVGDDLIELGMVQLLAEFGIRWSLWDAAAPVEHDALIFGGGGNMGTRYMNNHEIRGRALATGIPLTILPQSFMTAEDRDFERVYVRERTSLRLCPAGILAPDLSLGLVWPKAPRPTRDLGIFLRHDRERRGAKPLLARDPARICKTPADYLALAADHRRIVTDRLHFAIAGLHAARDVTLVANDYHKNRSMHETWLLRLGCRFAEDVQSALTMQRCAA